MPHDEACENATEPECHCACEGRLHGTKAGRPSAPRMGDAQIMNPSAFKDPDEGIDNPWRVNYKGQNGREWEVFPSKAKAQEFYESAKASGVDASHPFRINNKNPVT